VSRPPGGLLPLLVAGLLSACATPAPVRPPARDTAIPLNSPDARYAAYFKELKQQIEEKWVYPSEAVQEGVSGKGVVLFEVRKDGSVRTVEIVRSSGVRILDSYIENAIRLAAPFPPFPAFIEEDVLPLHINFSYIPGGQRPVSP
jgi:periplasmic protein TonB